MISNISAQTPAYVQKAVPKHDESKGVSETQKSEELDKTSLLKEQIANGTYTVDTSKTAQAVAEELF